jgi:hypothetical protein
MKPPAYCEPSPDPVRLVSWVMESYLHGSRENRPRIVAADMPEANRLVAPLLVRLGTGLCGLPGQVPLAEAWTIPPTTGDARTLIRDRRDRDAPSRRADVIRTEGNRPPALVGHQAQPMGSETHLDKAVAVHAFAVTATSLWVPRCRHEAAARLGLPWGRNRTLRNLCRKF